MLLPGGLKYAEGKNKSENNSMLCVGRRRDSIALLLLNNPGNSGVCGMSTFVSRKDCGTILAYELEVHISGPQLLHELMTISLKEG
jgi:hypothetical protein